MTTTIRLDSAAIALLFPEGSEQRVEITNAVAAEITRKMFKNDIEKLVRQGIATGKYEVESIANEILKEAFEVIGSFSSRKVILKDEYKKLIQTESKSAVGSLIHDEINEHLPKAVDAFIGDLVNDRYLRLKLRTALADEVGSMAQEALSGVSFKASITK